MELRQTRRGWLRRHAQGKVRTGRETSGVWKRGSERPDMANVSTKRDQLISCGVEEVATSGSLALARFPVPKQHHRSIHPYSHSVSVLLSREASACVMAQGGNFVEGRLRLSAYLRIVRNIPQHQPLRIRRRILESENDENHNNSHNNAEPVSTMVSDTRAEAETSNLASGGNEACQSHVVPPASALEAPEAVQNFAYPESDAPATDGASTTERDSFTFPSTPRRSVDVYTAKPDKVDPRLVTSTGRRRLPVNELALVRRTTDISLSDRSVGD